MEDLLFESQVKLNRDFVKKATDPISIPLLTGSEHNIASGKRKKRTLKELSTEERVCIAKLAATKALSHREIAERHNISA